MAGSGEGETRMEVTEVPPFGWHALTLLDEAQRRGDGRLMAATLVAIGEQRLRLLTGWRERIDREVADYERRNDALRELVADRDLAVERVAAIENAFRIAWCGLTNHEEWLQAQPSAAGARGDDAWSEEETAARYDEIRGELLADEPS
jgi:hypothetical protein